MDRLCKWLSMPQGLHEQVAGRGWPGYDKVCQITCLQPQAKHIWCCDGTMHA